MSAVMNDHVARRRVEEVWPWRAPAPSGGQGVVVHLDGFCALLTGSVRTRSERNAAVAAAWADPRVSHVIDEIVVHG